MPGVGVIGVVPQLGAEGVLPNPPPPKPVDAGGTAPKPGLDVPKPPVVDWPNVVEPLANPVPGVCIPPLFAPPSFSCVRPNAAIPNTAPMAM